MIRLRIATARQVVESLTRLAAATGGSARSRRPMRHCTTLFSIVIMSLLASCAPLRVAGIYTYGRIHEVDVSDVEAALAAYYALRLYPDTSVEYIEVIRYDEIRLYWGGFDGSYEIMKRVGKKWRHDGGVIVTS
jgi:hypothetical protein